VPCRAAKNAKNSELNARTKNSLDFSGDDKKEFILISLKLIQDSAYLEALFLFNSSPPFLKKM
jgi:hypothetical protein